MSRLTGPDEGSRLVYRTSGSTLTRAVGASVEVFSDAGATTHADIQTTGGSTIVGSTVLTDAYSRIPLFLFPDGVDTVYVVVSGGPITAVYARADDRLDALPATYAPIASAVASPLPFVRHPQQYSTTQDVTDSAPTAALGPRFIVPDAALFSAAAAGVWYGVNAATAMRFTVVQARTYRYVNLRVGVQSGNIQVGVVRLRPNDATPGSMIGFGVATSGVIACPAAGDQRLDLGYFTLTPGDYALYLWCDNTTAQFLHSLVTGITATRMTFSITVAGGIVSTANTLVNTTRWVSGLSLEASPLLYVNLGDSITFNDGTPATAWFSNMDIATGYRYYPVTNGGVAGETSAQILTRTAAAVVGARYVGVLAGTNDVAQDVPAATTIANLTAIYNLIVAAGATPLMCTITPRSNAAASSTPLTAPRAAALRTVNAWIRANYTTWPGARLVDWSWALSDGTDESSPLAANFGDYVHPNSTGCAIMQALLTKSLRDWN